MMLNRNPELLQRRAVADARQEKHLGRTDGTAGQDHLTPRFDAPRLIADNDIDAGRAAVLDNDARNTRLRHHRQIGAVACRLEKGGNTGNAPPIADGALAQAIAFRRRAVEIVAMPELQRIHRIGENAVERIGVLDVADNHRPLMTMPGRAGVLRIVFGAQEIGQHVRPAPAAVSFGRPVVIVLRMAAVIDHAVDGAGAAEHPATRNGDAPPIQIFLRNRLQAPAVFLQRQRRADQRRHVNEGM